MGDLTYQLESGSADHCTRGRAWYAFTSVAPTCRSAADPREAIPSSGAPCRRAHPSSFAFTTSTRDGSSPAGSTIADVVEPGSQTT